MTIQWFYKLRGDNTTHLSDRIRISLSTVIMFCQSVADSDHFDKDVYIINNVIYLSLTW